MSEFVEVVVTEAMRQRARRRAQTYRWDRNFNDPFIDFDGRVRSIIGELAFGSAYELAVYRDVSAFDYELLGCKLDIKTRPSTYSPRREYDVAIPAYEVPKLDRSSRLVFVVVLYSQERAWIVGWMPLSEFLSNARMWRKGERTVFAECKEDAYLLPIGKLRMMEHLYWSCYDEIYPA